MSSLERIIIETAQTCAIPITTARFLFDITETSQWPLHRLHHEMEARIEFLKIATRISQLCPTRYAVPPTTENIHDIVTLSHRLNVTPLIVGLVLATENHPNTPPLSRIEKIKFLANVMHRYGQSLIHLLP